MHPTPIIPWKTKRPKIHKPRGTRPLVDTSIPDWKPKQISKRFQKPYFSHRYNSYEIDLMDAGTTYYLMIININTRFLLVYPTKSKSADAIAYILTKFLSQYPCSYIRGDGERAFISKDVKMVLADSKVEYYFESSPYVNKSRIIDRAIRTIRDGFGFNVDGLRDPVQMKDMVILYNHTPHSAYNNLFTPAQVQNDLELEAMYIRAQQAKLDRIKALQQDAGILSYRPGNILYAHIDESRTMKKYGKVRRSFGNLVEFVEYYKGNVLVRDLDSGDKHLIPVHFTKFGYQSPTHIPKSVLDYFGIQIKEKKKEEEVWGRTWLGDLVLLKGSITRQGG